MVRTGTNQSDQYSSGLLHWHWGNTIAPVPVKQP